jgi:hypothetical protein
MDDLLLAKGNMRKTDQQMATKVRRLSSVQHIWNVANPSGLKKNVFPSKDLGEQKFLHLA